MTTIYKQSTGCVRMTFRGGIHVLLIGLIVVLNCLQRKPVIVDWTVASYQPAIAVVTLDGYRILDRTLTLSLPISGLIRRCKEMDGAEVNIGDTLVCLDNKDAWNMVARRRADLAMARVTLDKLLATDQVIAAQKLNQAKIIEASIRKKVVRAETMVLQGSITQAELDELRKEQALAQSQRIVVESEYSACLITEPMLQKSRIEKAQSLFNDAIAALSNTIITAPSNGKIIRQQYKVGEMYHSGSPLYSFFVIDTLAPTLLEASLPSSYDILPGQRVIIYDTIALVTGNAVVTAVIPGKADTISNTNGIIIALKNQAAALVTKGNVSVSVVIDTLSRAIVVEKRFLLQDGINYAVFVKRGDLAEKRSVSTSHTKDGNVIINTGIAEGDTMVNAIELESGRVLQLGKRFTE